MRIIEFVKNIDNKNEEEIANSIFVDKKNVTFTNPYSYLVSRKKKFKHLDFVYLDGFILVFIVNLFGIKTKRISMDYTSLAPVLFKKMEEGGGSIYLIGTTEDLINKTAIHLSNNHPKLNIAGFTNGYIWNNLEESVQSVIKNNPDVIVVGMGSPLQEKYSEKLREKGYQGGIVTCGGFLEQISKTGNYYPYFFQKFNLRFLFRIIDKPIMLKRYLIQYPVATALFLKDWLKCH